MLTACRARPARLLHFRPRPEGLVPRTLLPRCLLLGCLLLAACAGTQPSPAALLQAYDPFASGPAEQLFGPRPRLVSEAELFLLTPEQEEEVLRYLDDPRRAGRPRHTRVADYLSALTQTFEYDSETLPASAVLALRRGNCLSLALLTTAVARLAGVAVDYQLMDDRPVFEFQGSVVQKGVHVRSVLIDPAWVAAAGEWVFAKPGIRVDYFPTGNERFIANLPESGVLAMYYRNKAAEAIVAERPGEAWWQALESLRFAPDHAAAINLLAVASRRAGDLNRAEALYLHGLAQAGDKLSLLKNYALLLSQNGRHEEARRVRARLEALPDPSPMHWFHLAREAQAQGELEDALRYYRRAVELAPYLHEGYLGLAQASYLSGRLSAAESWLRRAEESALRQGSQQVYRAKLEALSRERALREGLH